MPVAEEIRERRWLGDVEHDKDGNVRCRVCRCTEDKACNPPCSWHFPDLCSSCAVAVEALLTWHEGSHRADWKRLQREVTMQLVMRDAHAKEQ